MSPGRAGRLHPARLLMTASSYVGGGSLLLFALFLLIGPYGPLDAPIRPAAALAWDTLLSLVFFLQHSGMVRPAFRRRLARWVPAAYHDALYALTAGIALLAVVLLWRPAGAPLLSVQGPARTLLRGLFVLGMVGFVWSIRSLGRFDAFGHRPIRARLRGREPRPAELRVRGPYRWVRHPQYACTLLLIWSFPDLTLDRLLLNLLWSAWIVLGARWEERDLSSQLGRDYLEYRRRVPMLIPGPPGRWVESRRTRH